MLVFALIVYCQTAASAQTIRTISVVGLERTRTKTVERELLFEVGDTFDSTRIAESVRNLRRLPFLGRIQIIPHSKGSDLHIEVRIQDLYARVLSPTIAGSINQLEYGLAAFDYNVGGRGERLRIALADQSYIGKSAEISFSKRRLLGSDHSVFARAYGSSEGHDVQWIFSKSFRTLESRTSYGLGLRDGRSQKRLFGAGTVIAQYETSHRRARFWYGTSHGKDTKIRPKIEVGYLDRKSPEQIGDTYKPRLRSSLYTLLSLTLWQPRYTTDRFVQRLGPIEDIQTGSSLRFRLGYTRGRSADAPSYYSWGLYLAPRWRIQNKIYLFSTLYLNTRRTNARFEHSNFLLQLQAYRRVGSNHSLALRLRIDALHRPEGIQQLALGLATGLRGFPSNKWVGNRRLIVNGELRPTFLHTSWATLGGTFFGDLGAAWTAPEKPSLYSAMGLGLRLNLTRIYNTPIWRLDVARNSLRSWHFSLGMGQYF